MPYTIKEFIYSISFNLLENKGHLEEGVFSPFIDLFSNFIKFSFNLFIDLRIFPTYIIILVPLGKF